MNHRQNNNKGDAVDVLIILVAIIFLLVVFHIDIIGYVHSFVLWIARGGR